MTIKQFLKDALQDFWPRCLHFDRSDVRHRVRTCLRCGERFEFMAYDLTDIDHRPVSHYIVRDRSIRRLQRQLLNFRRRTK
jgi:hypothetical protein